MALVKFSLLFVKWLTSVVEIPPPTLWMMFARHMFILWTEFIDASNLGIGHKLSLWNYRGLLITLNGSCCIWLLPDVFFGNVKIHVLYHLMVALRQFGCIKTVWNHWVPTRCMLQELSQAYKKSYSLTSRKLYRDLADTRATENEESITNEVFESSMNWQSRNTVVSV